MKGILAPAIVLNARTGPTIITHSHKRGSLMRNTLTLLVLLTAVYPLKTYAENPVQDIPWWRQEKIRFMWGQWS